MKTSNLTVSKSVLLAGLATLTALGLSAGRPASAQVTTLSPGVLEYGTENQEGVGPYSGTFNPAGFDPKAGATLSGLTAGQVTSGARSGGHTEFFPNAPAGDFAGTDTIHVGSTFTTLAHDGYAGQYLNAPSPGHVVKGPDTFALDYSSLLPAGQTMQTLTLGILADDFQFGKYGNPYTASINGVEATVLENSLNRVVLTDPSTQFFTFGIDPSLLNSSNVLNLSIDEKGDGGDGYAVDFLTVGVTTNAGPAGAPVPEASTTVSLGVLLALGLGGMALAARKRSLRSVATRGRVSAV